MKLVLRRKFDRKHIVLLFIGIMLIRTGINYVVYGQTGDWLIKPYQDTRFVMVNAGTPDSEGNRIYSTEILQDPGDGVFVSRGSVNYSSYTANYEIIGLENQTTRFVITSWINEKVRTDKNISSP